MDIQTTPDDTITMKDEESGYRKSNMIKTTTPCSAEIVAAAAKEDNNNNNKNKPIWVPVCAIALLVIMAIVFGIVGAARIHTSPNRN